MSEPDRTEIMALLDRCIDGWNAGSGEGFASIFAEGSDYVHVAGGILRGRKANADQHQKLFEGFLKGTKLAVDVLSTRFIRPDVALVHTRTRVGPPGGEVTGGVQSWVFAKNDGVWEAESFQNTGVPKDSPHANSG